MDTHQCSSPSKNAFCCSSRGNEAHFFQDISKDSRASWRRLLLFQQLVSALLAPLIFTEIGRADPLDTWTWRNPLPTGNNLNGITYGNGQFVAVGNLGTILTSTDGTNWIQQQSGTAIGLWGIAYGNGQFVAEGGPGIILTSADGVKWAKHQPGPVGPIAYGNGQFVAVGGDTVMTSADGVNPLVLLE